MTADALLAEMPLVAILRGVTPARIEKIAAKKRQTTIVTSSMVSL